MSTWRTFVYLLLSIVSLPFVQDAQYVQTLDYMVIKQFFVVFFLTPGNILPWVFYSPLCKYSCIGKYRTQGLCSTQRLCAEAHRETLSSVYQVYG